MRQARCVEFDGIAAPANNSPCASVISTTHVSFFLLYNQDEAIDGQRAGMRTGTRVSATHPFTATQPCIKEISHNSLAFAYLGLSPLLRRLSFPSTPVKPFLGALRVGTQSPDFLTGSLRSA